MGWRVVFVLILCWMLVSVGACVRPSSFGNNFSAGKSDDGVVDETYTGPALIAKVWSNFLRYPEEDIGVSASRAFEGMSCSKVNMGSTENGIGLPIYLGWNAKIDHRESRDDYEIEVYVDELEDLSVVHETKEEVPVSSVVFRQLVTEVPLGEPDFTVLASVPCVYFYSDRAYYRVEARIVHKSDTGKSSELSDPIVISRYVLINANDLTQYIQRSKPPSPLVPEDPDELRQSWVKVVMGSESDGVSETAQTYLAQTSSEFNKLLGSLEYLLHFYKDPKMGRSDVTMVRHFGDQTRYEDIDPFDYFVFLMQGSSSSRSDRHSIYSYRFEGGCGSTPENSSIEACRRVSSIFIYPTFFFYKDDFRRAAILLHEGSHKRKEDGGVGPHTCGRGADRDGHGSYGVGVRYLLEVSRRAPNCQERQRAYIEAMDICAMNIVGSKEFFATHCSSGGGCRSQWAQTLKGLGCTDMDAIVRRQGECVEGMDANPVPPFCV